MTSLRGRIDKPLAFIIATAVVGGGLLFASAAFGLLARGADHMGSVFLSHLGFGVGGGIAALLVASNLDYRLLRRIAPYLFAGALILTALVFVPHIGMMHGGGRRWILLGRVSFQPSEALKLATVAFAAAYCAAFRGKIGTLRFGLLGYLGILALPAAILVLQPDIGTLGVIAFSSLAVFWTAGLSVRDIAAAILLGAIVLVVLFFTKPYVHDRVMTFIHPSQGAQTQGYQIRQSLIAIGSGGAFGRGFGQGIQKFTYLPEPMGDSIFAVAGEELGFAGAVGIIALFAALAVRGFVIAARATDPFGAYLAAGIATYLSAEAFINIASMVGLAPLTGIPLTFISQGGSAMLVSLASAGALLSVSRTMRTHRT